MYRSVGHGECCFIAGRGDVFCGGCYANLRGRETCRGHHYSSVTMARRVTRRELFMKRPDPVVRPAKGTWFCCDAAFVKHYPTLAQGMSDTFWDDGKPRDPWTLTLRFDATGVSLCVNDKSMSMGLYTTGESVDDALALLENALKEGTGQWRRWRK